MSKQRVNARVIGIVALATLVALVGYSFYAGARRGASASRQIEEKTGTDLIANPASTVQSDMPRATDDVPKLPERGKTITAAVEVVNLSPAARMLAEKIQCVCGCKDILAACNCGETPGSRDMKQYLQQLVNDGKNPTEVVSLMEERYGAAIHPGK